MNVVLKYLFHEADLPGNRLLAHLTQVGQALGPRVPQTQRPIGFRQSTLHVLVP